MNNPTLNISYGLFCDLVRREDTGKFIIVGLFTQGIVARSFPFMLPLSVFRVVFVPGDLQVFKMSADAVVDGMANGSFDLSFGPFQFQAQREGHLSLQIQQHGQAWSEVERLGISAIAPVDA